MDAVPAAVLEADLDGYAAVAVDGCFVSFGSLDFDAAGEIGACACGGGFAPGFEDEDAAGFALLRLGDFGSTFAVAF